MGAARVAERAVKALQGKPVIVPLQIVDVVKEGDENHLLGVGADSCYFLLRCPDGIASRVADSQFTQRQPPFELGDEIWAIVCTVDSVKSSYGRERKAGITYEAEEDWEDSEAEVLEEYLYPRHVVTGHCLAVQELEGLDTAGNASKWWYDTLERAGFDEIKAFEELESE